MRFLLKSMKWISIFGIFCIMGYIGLYIYATFTERLPITSANNYIFYDNSNNLYKTNNSDEWISLEDISSNIIDATIAIEDKAFFSHIGFDYLRILKAMYTNIITGSKRQGASTISQQYAKNLFLDFDKTWNRKIEEAWLTIRLEMQYEKEEILEGYLNTINYGGIFGIENASQYYFGKSARDLNLAEASILAGIPKSPSNYSPLVNEEAAKKRQKIILNAMVKQGYITNEEMEYAYSVPLTYIGKINKTNSKILMYYQDAVMNELKNIANIPVSLLKTGGLKIYTNLDMNALAALENSMNKNITNENIQIAGVVMEPSTGKILALTGGRDYHQSQYNRATMAKRQVGSTMKPILYYSALENGFTPATTFTSEQTTFTFSEDKTYSPKNYGNTYPNKEISMTAAIAHSDNIYAVKTHLFLGEETLVDMAQRLGISVPLSPIPSLALGTAEINILDMMKAYAAFANNGYQLEPYFINKVTDIDGNILYQHKEEKTLILNQGLVYILNEMLTSTYAKELVDYAYPTCFNIGYKMSRKYAVKTGTTDTDLLVFGYNPDIIIGLWSGYDNNQEVIPSDSAALKNVWVDTIEEYLKDSEEHWYSMPNNVVGVLIDPITGKLADNNTKNKRMSYFLKGTEPNAELNFDNAIPTIKTEEESNPN